MERLFIETPVDGRLSTKFFLSIHHLKSKWQLAYSHVVYSQYANKIWLTWWNSSSDVSSRNYRRDRMYFWFQQVKKLIIILAHFFVVFLSNTYSNNSYVNHEDNDIFYQNPKHWHNCTHMYYISSSLFSI